MINILKLDDYTRLTERNESGGISVADLSAALKKLAELEDAEQNGRLAILPSETGQAICSNKDFVYIVDCVTREAAEAAFQKRVT